MAPAEHLDLNSPIHWKSVHAEQLQSLSEAERKLFSLLAQGKSQVEIGKILNLHRSAVWRRVARLRKKFESQRSD